MSSISFVVESVDSTTAADGLSFGDLQRRVPI